MIVRFRVPLRTSARIRFSGMPQSPMPPSMTTAPSGTSRIASSALATTLFIASPGESPGRYPTAIRAARRCRAWSAPGLAVPSAALAPVHSRRGRGVVPVAAPRGMIVMDHEVAVVRGDGGGEGQLADVAPVAEGTPLEGRHAARRAFIGDFDVEGERAPGFRICAVVDLRHHLVPEVQGVPWNPRLIRSDQEAHVGRRPRGLAPGLAELGDLVELADRGLLVGRVEGRAAHEQDRHASGAAPGASVRSVAQLRVVDGRGELAADVLLGEEAGGAQRVGMVRIDGREQLPDQRQRPRVAPSRLGAAGGITTHGESLATLAEVPGILRVLRDLPAAGETYAVRMRSE